MNHPSLPRLRRLLAAGLAMFAATGAYLVAATDAQAAAYIHQSCMNGADVADAYGGWQPFNTHPVLGTGTRFECPLGGLHATMSPTSSAPVPLGGAVGWTYTAPPGTTLSRLWLDYAGATRNFDGSNRGVIQILDGHGTIASSSSGEEISTIARRIVDWNGLNGTTVTVRVICDGPTGKPACSESTGWASFYYPRLTLVDDTPPDVGAPSGSATGDPTWKDSEALGYAATDQGGGLARFRLSVDGTVTVDHAVDASGSHCNATATDGGLWVFPLPKPCPGSVSTIETIDTTKIPDGQHTITARVVDAAQRDAVIWSGSRVVANHPPVNSAAPSFAQAADAASPIVGLKLTAKDGEWGGPSLTFARGWQQCDTSALNCVQIPGATSADYVPTAADVGHRLRFAVTATNAAASVIAFSPATGVVAAPSSAEPPTPKPDPTPDTPAPNGSNGSNGSNGNGGTTIVIPNLTTTNTERAEHTLIGRVVGERAGVACPNDKATLKFQHIVGGRTKLGYGKSGIAQLQLTCTESGKAIEGAKLEIATKTGAQAAVASDVTTDGAGHATLRLGKGGSRGIVVGYRMYADDPMARATATLRVLVTGRVSLSANRKRLTNGRAVTLKGSLAGGLVPKRGVNLAMQWKDGKRWRPFAQIKSDSKGRFHYAYKFTRTNRTVVYRLRAQVGPGQVDYPFVATASKPVRITVAR
ncbi:MAG TPA: hypothetical protein VK501_15315 [Baekduia sp.]|uniref:hypothetical protein n=1 Tax=Baekduia sp. TaxID=2600305 RepID=UPI002C698A18|nr:hypothetical protein [Baekduia sp.]HMJ35278.1 hypothetical protein [Baekduia sp.]